MLILIADKELMMLLKMEQRFFVLEFLLADGAGIYFHLLKLGFGTVHKCP